jgi:hypothetical protein
MTSTPRSMSAAFCSAVAGVAFGLWLAACGGSTSKTAMPRATTGSDASPDAMGRGADDQRRAEIERRSGEITAALESRQMAAPTADQVAEAMSAGTMPEVDTCEGGAAPPTTPECSDSCTIAGSICDNATQICRIADELAPDEWAAGKCGEATASCDLAHDRCCDCS